MNEYDSNIIETVQRLIHDYRCDHQGINPKTIFISESLVALLKTQCKIVMNRTEDDGFELTLCGLKVYEVIQDGVIKITD